MGCGDKINCSEERDPRNEVEASMLEVWKEVLNAKDIGINDNFFRIGGNSIMAFRVLAILKKKGIYISQKDFFKSPQISQLSNLVSVAENKN